MYALQVNDELLQMYFVLYYTYVRSYVKRIWVSRGQNSGWETAAKPVGNKWTAIAIVISRRRRSNIERDLKTLMQCQRHTYEHVFIVFGTGKGDKLFLETCN